MTVFDSFIQDSASSVIDLLSDADIILGSTATLPRVSGRGITNRVRVEVHETETLQPTCTVLRSLHGTHTQDRYIAIKHAGTDVWMVYRIRYATFDEEGLSLLYLHQIGLSSELNEYHYDHEYSTVYATLFDLDRDDLP